MHLRVQIATILPVAALALAGAGSAAASVTAPREAAPTFASLTVANVQVAHRCETTPVTLRVNGDQQLTSAKVDIRYGRQYKSSAPTVTLTPSSSPDELAGNFKVCPKTGDQLGAYRAGPTVLQWRDTNGTGHTTTYQHKRVFQVKQASFTNIAVRHSGSHSIITGRVRYWDAGAEHRKGASGATVKLERVSSSGAVRVVGRGTVQTDTVTFTVKRGSGTYQLETVGSTISWGSISKTATA